MPDHLNPRDRSRLMSRIRSKDTGIEIAVRKTVFKRGLRYRIHAKDLPGKPDLVFRKARVAVFVDGDFWHGWRFSDWQHKLKPYWAKKIEGNKLRDQRNFAELQRRGWLVVRVWGHEVLADVECVADRIEAAVKERIRIGKPPAHQSSASTNRGAKR
ncbi:MAG: very short patch repair endonuclease [Chloroflexi bacterium]|nr:very short patch repair endonuclease [Chloroflexota bacterium]